MADYREKLRDTNFQNWVKSSLGLCITKEGVVNFVIKVIGEFHTELLSTVLSSDQIERAESCTQCRKENILKCPTKGLCTVRAGVCSTHDKGQLKIRPCPNSICDKLREAIIKGHLFHQPSWKNTHAEQWCTNSWEIAKCYMPPDGYLDKRSIAETDLNGVLSVMCNFKGFASKLAKQELDEVRAIGRQIRHSSELSVEESAVNAHLDKMIKFLTSLNDSLGGSTKAVENLKKLKTNDLIISTEDVTNVLMDTMNESVKLHQQDLKGRRDQYMQEIKDALQKGVANESKYLSDILKAGDEVLKAIERARRDSIQNIRQRYNSCNNDDYEQRKLDLKEDLLIFYKDVHGRVPVSPLVPGNGTPLLEFYVQQKMEVVEWKREPPSRKLVKSYKDLFTESSRYIYIAAHAGAGKTTFLKRICNVWCYSKQQHGKEPENLSDSAIEILKMFDFLFLVLLADVQYECDVDDMIESQIIASLSRSRAYDIYFIQQLLHHEKCLVLLDGVDEWSHPKGVQCRKRSPLPHLKSRNNWTVLSTSRPWKIHSAELGDFMIDKYIEFIDHDYTSIIKLTEKVISILENVHKTEKQHCDFIEETEQKGISELIYTPVLLIQMICLWHDDRPLGNTRCQIYSNIIEFILQRGQTKLQNCPLPHVPDNHIGLQTEPPVCLKDHGNFQQFYCHLIDIGKFAFKALTGENRESSLMFGASMTEDCLSKEQLQLCLHIGLLTESRMRSSVSQHMSKFSFIHQTFQEYFCALYLATLSDDKCEEKIAAICRSVETTLKFSTVIVFLSGLRPEYLNFISRHLSGVIAADSLTVSFRRSIGTAIDWDTRFKMMKDLQNMYTTCNRECKDDLHNTEIRLEDFFIDCDYQNPSVQESLKTLIGMNAQTIKSIKMYDCQITGRISSYVEQCNLNQIRSLERLEIVGQLAESELINLINGSAETLLSISLCKDLRRYGQQIETKISTSVKSFNIIRNMVHLEALMLECFKLPHSQLADLFTCISKRHAMKQIGLGFLYCSDHGKNCSGVGINLSEHSSLQFLQLGEIPLSDVQINTKVLEKCRVGRFSASTSSSVEVLSKILNNFHDAEKLRELMFFDFRSPQEVYEILHTLPTLEQLQVIVFKRVDFKDQLVNLPLDINHIKLSDVQMSAVAFENLVDRSENVPVKFELLECGILPEEKYQAIKVEIKVSKNYMLWYDELVQGSAEQFAFTKIVKGPIFIIPDNAKRRKLFTT